MKLFSRLSALALGALSTVSVFGSAAHAIYPGIARQNPSEAEVASLVRVAESVGVAIYTENNHEWTREKCKEGMYGMAIQFRDGRKFVALCVGNHGGDWEELTDTLRHEMTHIAQYCNDGLLDPQNNARYMAGTREIGWDIQGTYPRKSWAVEAEAFYFAHYFNEATIGKIVTAACG